MMNPILGQYSNKSVVDEVDSKRIYFCQRCLNHGFRNKRRNHKAKCIFLDCPCAKCILIIKRRELNTKLTKAAQLIANVQQNCGGNGRKNCQQNSTGEGENAANYERIPSCQKCGQHGLRARLKGHKGECPYRDCECTKCSVISERQKLMAKQIKIRRQQRKEFGGQIYRQEEEGEEDSKSLLEEVAQTKATSCPNFGQNESIPISQNLELMDSAAILDGQIVSPIPLLNPLLEFQFPKQPLFSPQINLQFLQFSFSMPQLPSTSFLPLSFSDLQLIQQNLLLQLLISNINQ